MADLACSGLARENTGIGVVQRNLYPHLEREFGPLRFSPVRDLGRTPWQRIVGLINGFRPPAAAHSVYVSAVPPLPLALPGKVISIVHDLRWLRTRGFLSRQYRMWDLKRTVSRSDYLVCISQRTYDDLVAALPVAARKAVVAWLGPGLIPPNSFDSAVSGRLLLIGGAAHKDNESAARLLAKVKPDWLTGITGIGVSNEVQSIIEEAFGPTFGTWLKNVTDDEVIAAYKDSEFFMLLGKDEGFGLPFVEALASGCQVIAFDQPLTRELFGPACTYLNGNDEGNARVLEKRPCVPEAVRRQLVERFSWKKFADTVIDKARSSEAE
jgi:glycosyltransferase involved in cell wall biosynthesis